MRLKSLPENFLLEILHFKSYHLKYFHLNPNTLWNTCLDRGQKVGPIRLTFSCILRTIYFSATLVIPFRKTARTCKWIHLLRSVLLLAWSLCSDSLFVWFLSEHGFSKGEDVENFFHKNLIIKVTRLLIDWYKNIPTSDSPVIISWLVTQLLNVARHTAL
jgi:hypothetical protein